MINKAIIVGNLGKDPEVSYTPGGTAVAKFSVATSEKWKDKNTGEMQERTEWHRITAFGRLGEICGEYLSKGRQVYVEGRIQTSSWEKDGITRYSTEIIASEMKMLGTKGGGDTYSPPGPSTMPEYMEPPRPGKEDDDIPF
ncbi:MAG: single-stranded DNA-binding protein [Pseudomonadota bacterium]|jgi:single-strand DNA-binding protein